MNKGEIARHKPMKDRFADYPRLPKFILNDKKTDKGHQESCLSGFLRRVGNWEKAKYRRELGQQV